MSDFIYLASQSPRRRQLLEQIGVPVRMLLPGADEDAEGLESTRDREAPAAYVERVTRAKLGAACTRLAARGLAGAPILCADTTVALNDRIIGKPLDADDARCTLRALAGVVHLVIMAVAVWTPPPVTGAAACAGEAKAVSGADAAPAAGSTLFAINTSSVLLGELSDADIDAYVVSGDCFGKAGSYAIQGPAGAWVRHIEGSYSGIMGLPLFETAQLLKQAGVHR